MKELSIEQKAEYYDEAIKVAKSKIKNDKDHVLYEEDIYDIFPVLKENKESEDEKIRKWLIALIRSNEYGSISDVGVMPCPKPRVLAWLEKRGEYQKFISAIQIGDKVTRNKNGMLVNLSQLKRVAKYADEVKPKFKVGDWVILTAGELSTTLQIVKVDTDKKLYWFNDSSYLPIVDEECLHLWSIQDAKDGDVLNSVRVKATIIFKRWNPDGKHLNAYCALQKGILIKQEMLWDRDFEPATKEQRDTLIKAIANAGYEFDFEKKELRKLKFKVGDIVKSKSQPMLKPRKIISIGKDCYRCEDRGCIGFAWEDDLELVEQRPVAWSEEDENIKQWIISDIEKLLTLYKKSSSVADKEIKWLKAIKDRVQPQPKQEWSEEDGWKINRIYSILRQAADTHAFSTSCRLIGDKECIKLQDFLKSLRPHNTWKPSDEQMEALDIAIRCGIQLGTWEEDALKSLKEQLFKLKKLRKE